MSAPGDERDGLAARKAAWEARAAAGVASARTDSDIPVKLLYTPAELAGHDADRDLGFPGEFPYTRGIYPTMYRGRLWTMRLYSGFSTADDTNARFRYLLDQGQTGLSVALDLPTQMGMDSDHPLAAGEVGKVGVAIDTLADMEAVFEGIPLDKISTSFTINATAAILLAMYAAVAERQGVDGDRITGTIQNDILKEYIARNTYIYGPRPSLRLATDTIEYCSRALPKFNPISVCGYHMRQAGCDAVQEIAFTLANALVYVDAVVARGVSIDDFAPRISFNLSTMSDLFEEVAKHRATRRLWARLIRERYAPRDPRSMMFRFFSGGDGTSLTAEEPLNNIVRVTLHQLGIILGGAQAVHTVAYDEALGIPTEESALIALRTQQILAYESGITRTVDPLAGSYYVESLTDELERRARETMGWIEAQGGMLQGIERGVIGREILARAWELQRRIESGTHVIVGVNRFRQGGGPAAAPARPAVASVDDVRQRQLERLRRVKARRDGAAVRRSLDALRDAAEGADNLVPPIFEAVKAYATVGEISDTLKTVFGAYRPAGEA